MSKFRSKVGSPQERTLRHNLAHRIYKLLGFEWNLKRCFEFVDSIPIQEAVDLLADVNKEIHEPDPDPPVSKEDQAPIKKVDIDIDDI